MRPPAAGLSGQYAWLLGGISSWFLATGIHQVMLTWLLVGELNVPSSRVGMVQMLGTLPILLLSLVAGAAADRTDRRRFLMTLHVLAAFLSITLAVAVATGSLSLTTLTIYVVGWGTVQAFNQPARDALISDLAISNLLRGVIGVTVAQFGAMMIGARIAGLGQGASNGWVIGFQAVLLLAGIMPLARLPAPTHTSTHSARPMSLAEVREGFLEVRRTPGLLAVTVLVAANGLFFNGPFLVLCPVILRDLYQANQHDYALVMMALPMGTLIGSLALFWRGRVRRKGPVFLAALLAVSFCLIALSLRPPLLVVGGIIVVWGIGYSLFFNVSRTLFQEAAPATHRGRVLAIYPLAFLGVSPVSTFASGLLGDWIGPLETCVLAGVAMVVITTLAWISTPIRRIGVEHTLS